LRRLLPFTVACLAVSAFAGEPAKEEPAASKTEEKDAAAEDASGSAPAWHGDALTLSGTALREAPGTFGDPLRAVTLLPGVATLASGLGYAVVRGAQPAATGYFLDGVRVPVLFHLVAAGSVIDPETVDRIDFIAGTPPASYGRFLGGIVNASIREPDQRRASVTLDLLNVGGLVQQPIPEWGTEVSISGRIAYTPFLAAVIANAMRSAPAKPTYSLQMFDYQADVEQRVGAGRARLLAFGSSDAAGQFVPGGDTIAPALGFHRLDLRLRYPLGKGQLEVAGTAGLDRLQAQVGGGAVFGFDVDERVWGARASFSQPLAQSADVDLGADLEIRDSSVLQTSSFPGPVVGGVPTAPVTTSVEQPVGTAVLTGAYAEGHLSWSGWSFRPGLRFDRYELRGYPAHLALEPRLSVEGPLPAGFTLFASGGLQHQTPTTLIPAPGLDVARTRLLFQEAIKLEAGVERALPWRLSARASAFFEPMTRVLELSPLDADFQQQVTTDPDAAAARVDARAVTGMAYGAELLLVRRSDSPLNGWISYAFLQSLRRTPFDRLDAYGQPTGAVESADLSSPLEQQHVLNCVVEYRLPARWRIAANLHFNSGTPEAGGIASYTMREGTTPLGVPHWYPVDRDQVGRMPSFWRLDARASKRWEFAHWALDAYLDVFNIAVSQETVRFTYGESRAANGTVTLTRGALKLPLIVPFLGTRASF